ncbi:MAG: hypothetical protein IPH53_02440 [Flavobacteriales bacterium]|nr:hypothetical protein [Flavobacteriales bacterium]
MVDASPMGLVSEYVIITRHVDVTLYVVRENYTHRSALRLVNEMYLDKKVGRIDLLLNDVKAGQGYGSGYYANSLPATCCARKGSASISQYVLALR